MDHNRRCKWVLGWILIFGSAPAFADSFFKKDIKCFGDLKELLEVVFEPKGPALVSALQDVFHVPAEAGRMGFLNRVTPPKLARGQAAALAELLEQAEIPFSQAKVWLNSLSLDHPEASAEEWIDVLSVSIRADLDPLEVSDQLKTLREMLKKNIPPGLGFSQSKRVGELKFVELWEIWVLGLRLEKDLEFVARRIFEAQVLFSEEPLSSHLNFVLWGQRARISMARLHQELSEIKMAFRYDVGGGLGFNKGHKHQLEPSLDQALVIHQALRIFKIPPNDLYFAIGKQLEAFESKNLEDAIEPIRLKISQAQENLDDA